jgi:hypothetical protein
MFRLDKRQFFANKYIQQGENSGIWLCNTIIAMMKSGYMSTYSNHWNYYIPSNFLLNQHFNHSWFINAHIRYLVVSSISILFGQFNKPNFKNSGLWCSLWTITDEYWGNYTKLTGDHDLTLLWPVMVIANNWLTSSMGIFILNPQILSCSANLSISSIQIFYTQLANCLHEWHMNLTVDRTYGVESRIYKSRFSMFATITLY